MRIAVGVLYGFDSPFLVCLLDTYTSFVSDYYYIPLNSSEQTNIDMCIGRA